MLFTREDVDEALRALVNELVASGAPATIDVVGGAAVSPQVEREALPQDIDALHPAPSGFTDAVGHVGAARGWPDTWLNDAVTKHVSHFDTMDDWEIRIEGDGWSCASHEPSCSWP